MRAITFRAKALINDKYNNIKVGDFVYGHYIENGCDAPCIIFGDGEQIEVDRRTLGQRTGQKDCKKIDTYEGDIASKTLIDGSIHKCVIRYSDKYSKFIFCPMTEKWDFDRDVVDNPFDRETYMIIGNQNTEVIKESSNKK
jgi:hypothetical protein